MAARDFLCDEAVSAAGQVKSENKAPPEDDRQSWKSHHGAESGEGLQGRRDTDRILGTRQCLVGRARSGGMDD
jgi:hypothetical protein